MQTKIKEYITKWENLCYFDGIPDEVPNEINHLCPSWKKIAVCILKNDLHLSGLGYKQPYSDYYAILKRIEIEQRVYVGKQLKLFK